MCTANNPSSDGEGWRMGTIGEIPFELPLHQALAFGDPVLGIDGGLRVWPRKRDTCEQVPSTSQVAVWPFAAR